MSTTYFVSTADNSSVFHLNFLACFLRAMYEQFQSVRVHCTVRLLTLSMEGRRAVGRNFSDTRSDTVPTVAALPAKGSVAVFLSRRHIVHVLSPRRPRPRALVHTGKPPFRPPRPPATPPKLSRDGSKKRPRPSHPRPSLPLDLHLRPPLPLNLLRLPNANALRRAAAPPLVLHPTQPLIRVRARLPARPRPLSLRLREEPEDGQHVVGGDAPRRRRRRRPHHT